jgi:hypothetical protein
LIPVSRKERRQLLVKLDESQLWFMRFPFTSYIHLKLGEFANYTNVSWIVTDRSFTEVVEDHLALKSLFRAAPEMLQGALIVVNRYAAHFHSPVFGKDVRNAVELLLALLRQFENVWYDNAQYSLRCLVDPSSDQLSRALLDPQTRLVMAAFEAGDGSWQLGDYMGEDIPPSRPSFFDLAPFRGKLPHVQLLRIFHCNSVFQPYNGGEPADSHSIARQLLATDAEVVEGGITEESPFDFFNAVLQLIYKSDLYYILESRSLTGLFELEAITAECDRILDRWGYDPITSTERLIV